MQKQTSLRKLTTTLFSIILLLLHNTGWTQNARLNVFGNTNTRDTVKAAFYLKGGQPFMGSQWTTTGSNIFFNIGNIGIGDATPAEKLSITGNIKASGTITATGLNISGPTQFDSILISNRIKVGNSIIIDGISNTNTANNIYTDPTLPTDLLIQSIPGQDFNTILNANNYGQVIIGTANPNDPPLTKARLRVHGSISVYDGNGNTSLFFGEERFNPNPNNVLGEWGIQYWAGSSKGGNGWGGLNVWKPFGSTGTTGNGFLFLQDDGNIGVGCENPAYRLDVNGTIRAKEFRINLNGCDFVFDEKYSLLPLRERRIIVLKQKHLLNIVSAKEMQSGTSLGETMMGILQNVEEHEKYLYQQNDEIEKLKQENVQLKTDLELLKTEMETLKKKQE